MKDGLIIDISYTLLVFCAGALVSGSLYSRSYNSEKLEEIGSRIDEGYAKERSSEQALKDLNYLEMIIEGDWPLCSRRRDVRKARELIGIVCQHVPEEAVK